jgi:integrase
VARGGADGDPPRNDAGAQPANAPRSRRDVARRRARREHPEPLGRPLQAQRHSPLRDIAPARVLPELGGRKLSDIRRSDLQDFADRLLAKGVDASTIRNTLMPLRAIFRRAVARGDVGVNPTSGLELPAVRGRRDRIASPEEASRLVEALPERDRTLWATALYGGLRRGELQALRWDDVDLANGVIRIERAWDVREGAIEPKSRAGRRTVPLAAVLRDQLVEHKQRRGSDELVFGRPDGKAFDGSTVDARAKAAWREADSSRSRCTRRGTPSRA